MQSTAAIRAQPLVAKVVTQKAARKQIVVRAVAQQDDGAIQSRRAALALAAAAVIGFGAAESAQANGAAKNLSRASMSSFDMEGTKKQGISAKRKAKLIARLRKNAGAPPAPSE